MSQSYITETWHRTVHFRHRETATLRRSHIKQTRTSGSRRHRSRVLNFTGYTPICLPCAVTYGTAATTFTTEPQPPDLHLHRSTHHHALKPSRPKSGLSTPLLQLSVQHIGRSHNVRILRARAPKQQPFGRAGFQGVGAERSHD